MNWFEIFSILLGWSYTLCWGISFYPQVLLNFKRKSVKGVSIDFLVLNVLGFICYSISTSALLFSKTVRKEYSDQFLINDQANQQLSSSSNRLKTPNVRFNDLVFSLHALILSLITCLSYIVFPASYNYLNLIRSVSSVKVLISIIKYLPQLNMNFKRKSTIGWSIGNIILDLLGGILSLFQMVLDSGLAHDWSSLTSNPGNC
ncbi:PQ loop repeat-domain-containing protein [Phakopsora pachyrhizi]|uniref:PQ loop repeat-domain-containing protein n=1 Tax=Phakopsora pachyrhizi TaxID=170000 RepID=A0AAV0AV24_PHAPC|nr:PQ loop repeat-domain-containing protein [Phakopsora pachyrhizi]